MKDLFSLKNKIALVTGGSMGIGSMQAELSSIGPCEYIQGRF